MAFSMAGGGPSHPQINVTPLIDVLLVLIIVFMVVVSLSKQKGLEAQIPQPAEDQNGPVAPDRTIVIQVAWNRTDQPPLLKINQETVKWEDLQKRLHDIYKLRAERVAFVRGDDDVDFQYVAEVIDIAREAGVERVGLLTKDRGFPGE
jgi:biopolymer transport protein TolR